MIFTMTDLSATLENGETVRVPASTSVGETLSRLQSNKQQKRTVAARVNGVIVDLSAALTEDAVLSPIQIDSEEGLAILRHSTAHVMAEAVKDIFGAGIKVAIGPSIENGFYYDFLRDEPFSPEDFDRIEQRMEEIAASGTPFIRTEIDSTAAIASFAGEGEKYKVELIEDLQVPTVSLYKQGSFTDLCRGPHLPNTSFIKAFKLLRVAGAYWRGDEKKDVLQRIYGTAFFDKKDLKKYLDALEEAKKNVTIAGWARNWSSSPPRTRSALGSSSGCPRGHSCGGSSKTSGRTSITNTITSCSTLRISRVRTSGGPLAIWTTTARICMRPWISMRSSIS